MSDHKLGWQTSEQQNKTVSCEGGGFNSSVLGVQSAFLKKLFFKKKKKGREIRNPS